MVLHTHYTAIVKSKIKVFEENAWSAFVLEHPSFDFAKSCSELVPSQNYCLLKTRQKVPKEYALSEVAVSDFWFSQYVNLDMAPM